MATITEIMNLKWNEDGMINLPHTRESPWISSLRWSSPGIKEGMDGVDGEEMITIDNWPMRK